MADHIAEQILAKILTILTTNTPPYPTDAGANIFRNRTIPISESLAFPFINLMIGKDVPVDGRVGYSNVSFVDSELEILFDLCVSSIAQDVDTKLNQLRKQLHLALVPSGVTNLSMSSNVQFIYPGECEEPVVHSEAAKQIVTMRQIWKVRYRTSLADPTH